MMINIGNINKQCTHEWGKTGFEEVHLKMLPKQCRKGFWSTSVSQKAISDRSSALRWLPIQVCHNA